MKAALAELEAYAALCRDSAAEQLAALEADVDGLGLQRSAVPTLLDACRRAEDYANRITAFVARAQAGRVDAATLNIAVQAIRSLRK